jgi:Cro/C1-type HTH DNA-binding domain
LAARSAGRIAPSTVYRWVQLAGRLQSIDTQALDDVCDILGVEVADVIEREPRRRGRRQDREGRVARARAGRQDAGGTGCGDTPLTYRRH